MLSKQAYEEIMAQFGSRIVPVTHPLSRFVQRVAGNIIRVSGMTDLEWEVHLIDYPQRNAFVLPGGKVFVFTGILPVVGDENGLAAVLGHEIAHQVARHSAEKMSWVKVIVLGQILLSFFFDPGFIFNRLFMELGVMMPFSRLCESEADLIGLKLMAQACYDPRAAIRMWENMKVADGGERQMEYLSTHPSHENRIAKITEWMPEALEIREKSDCKEVSPLWGLFKRLR
ncbi:peptidase M48 [Zopfochytrium polystomum]|nr:peptidase M48 [Zopfochytrium polystomum]